MVIINGHKLYEVPSSCGTCPFLLTGNTDCPGVGSGYSKGICLQWDGKMALVKNQQITMVYLLDAISWHV